MNFGTSILSVERVMIVHGISLMVHYSVLLNDRMKNSCQLWNNERSYCLPRNLCCYENKVVDWNILSIISCVIIYSKSISSKKSISVLLSIGLIYDPVFVCSPRFGFSSCRRARWQSTFQFREAWCLLTFREPYIVN